MTYSPPTLTGYSSTYAPDDGSAVAGNQITLAGVVNNLTDPLRTYAAAISAAISTAFSSLLLGQTSTKTGNFSVSATNDPGKVFNCTNALTASLPAASTAGDGFSFAVYNNSAGAIVIDGNSSETINGDLTITLDKKYSAAFFICNGTAWYAFIINQLLLTQVSLASATTTDLGAALSNNVNITGTTTITSLGSNATTVNPFYFIKFAGILTFTHNATSLIIPGGANITTAAGDTAMVEYLGSGNWRVRNYSKADGTAVISGLPSQTGNSGKFLKTDGSSPSWASTIFSALYTSSDQTITSAGQIVLAHGLGSAPPLIQYYLVCQSGEGNYSTSDVVGVDFSSSSSGNDHYNNPVIDATNITIRYSSDTSAFAIANKTTGAVLGITNASWKLRVKAWI